MRFYNPSSPCPGYSLQYTPDFDTTLLVQTVYPSTSSTFHHLRSTVRLARIFQSTHSDQLINS